MAHHLRGGGEAVLESVLSSTESFTVPWSRGELLAQRELFDLHCSGVVAGDQIALLVPNGPCAALCLVATMRQYCVTPLNPSAPAENVAASLTRLRARCIVSPASEKVTFASQQACIPHVVLHRVDGHPGAFDLAAPHLSLSTCFEDVAVASSDRVLVLQTSGTTSEPKLVPFSLQRLMDSGRALAESIQLNADDVGLNTMPLHHVGGIACNLIAPIVAGSRMVYAAWSDASAWYAFIEDTEPAVTWCYAAPAIWSVVTAHGEATDSIAPHTMRLLRSGAAPLPHAEATRLAALFGEKTCVLPTYSMTVRTCMLSNAAPSAQSSTWLLLVRARRSACPSRPHHSATDLIVLPVSVYPWTDSTSRSLTQRAGCKWPIVI